LVIIISFLTSEEAIKGLLQIFGLVASNNFDFLLTGSFGNPGPYGGFIAVGMSSAIGFIWFNKDWKKLDFLGRITFFVSCGALFLGIIVLPASLSRAAWLAFFIVLLLLGLSEYKVKDWIRKNRRISLCVLAFIMVLGGLCFSIKRQSAMGRFHIWRIECLAIADEPFKGHGNNSFLGTYGDTQAKFFSTKERNERTKMVAGCPEYAFNEYLKIGVEHGLVALSGVLFLIAAIIYSLRIKQSPLQFGMIAFCVFAFFSYPLSLWQFKVYLGAYLLAAIPEFGHWKSAYSVAIILSIILYFMFLIKPPKASSQGYKAIFHQAYQLHEAKEYSRSNELLKRGASMSCDPMFHIIMGKNYEALGDFGNAEKEYMFAHYMVPCRLYPFVLLMEMKESQGDYVSAIEYGQKVLSMPINERNGNMKELRQRAVSCLNALQQNCHESR